MRRLEPRSQNGLAVSCLPAAIGIIALAFAQNASASVSISDQLRINADKIQVRQTSGQVQYLGQVHIRHGNLRINGDRALVTLARDGGKSVTVWGKPVQVDFSKQDGAPVKLSCEELTYTSQLRELNARDSAMLQSSEGTLSAGQLNYSLATETFSLAGTASQPRINAILAIPATATGGASAK